MQTGFLTQTPRGTEEDEEHISDNSRPRRVRLARRRGRFRDGALSDDEVQRETDSGLSESESMTFSSDTASESEAGSDEEDLPINDPTRVEIPDTTHSLSSAEVPSTIQNPRENSTLRSNTNWSDMVADAALSYGSNLPIINFTDMLSDANDFHADPTPEAARNNFTDDLQFQSKGRASGDSPIPRAGSSSSRKGRTFGTVNRRPAGRSAREAYRERLQTDPSFVPIVGEFWGHDDRLLQKDLRSLSDWWRGRWQGRGRGRGIIQKGVRGRPNSIVANEDASQQQEALTRMSRSLESRDIDRAWTHDGYEEMKAKEERKVSRRRVSHLRHQSQNFSIGGSNFNHREHVSALSQDVSTSATSHFLLSSNKEKNGVKSHTKLKSDKPWFTMKPERTWTKQHDGFLYHDTSKQRRDHIYTVRVKLPGRPSSTIRMLFPILLGPFLELSRSPGIFEEPIVVHLPKANTTNIYRLLSNGYAVAQSPDLASRHEGRKTVFATEVQEEEENKSALSETHIGDSLQPSFNDSIVFQKQNSGDRTSNLAVRSTIPQSQAINGDEPLVQSNVSHNIYSPQAHPAYHVYTSPYPYIPQLPPGIALDQQGYPFEITTGRPVYLHAASPSMSMYDSRTVAPSHGQSVQYVPGPSAHFSSEFIRQGPNLNGFVDPHTGGPLFSLPRQSTRVEIRAPNEASEGKIKIEQSASHVNAGSSHNYQEEDAIFSHDPTKNSSQERISKLAGAETRSERQLDSNAPPFSPYQNPYYYPDQYADHYHQYPMYVDMTQPNPRYDTYQNESQLSSVYYAQ